MVPNDEVGQEAFAVIREAVRDKGMVALGRVVLSKRERVIALQPWGKGLLGATLRYASEVRDAKDYFDALPDVKVERDLLKLAEHILNSKKADFDPTEFVDHYEEALVEMLRKKQMPGHVRLSVGIGHIDDIIADLIRHWQQRHSRWPQDAGQSYILGQSQMPPGHHQLHSPLTRAGSRSRALPSISQQMRPYRRQSSRR
jgi:DNA end-binding protein Ku